jgi:hypothetical protein
MFMAVFVKEAGAGKRQVEGAGKAATAGAGR